MVKKIILVAVSIIVLSAMAVVGIASTSLASADDGQQCGDAQGKGREGFFRMPIVGHGLFGGEMIGRVAAILNIDQQKLEDAIKQAYTELAKDGKENRFSNLVSSGKLTQEQADRYKAWLDAKPEGVPFLGGFDSSRSTEFMDKLLGDGKITQSQYDAWKTWVAGKPDIELPLLKRSGPFTNRQAPSK